MRFVRVTEIVIIAEYPHGTHAYNIDLDRVAGGPLARQERVTIRTREGWLPISRTTYMRDADPDLREHGAATEIFLAGLSRDDYRILVRQTLAEIWRRYDEDFRFVEVTDRRSDLGLTGAAGGPGN